MNGVKQRLPPWPTRPSSNDLDSLSNETMQEKFSYMMKLSKYRRVESAIKLGERYAEGQGSVNCANRHENCAIWASEGLCEKNPQKMFRMCGPICQGCHLMKEESWQQTAFRRKDLVGVFEGIKFGALSKDLETSFYEYIEMDSFVPVVFVDNLLQAEDCDSYINFIESWSDFEIVNDGNKSSYQVKSCHHACREESLTKKLIERIIKLTGVSEENIEDFTFEKYENGNFQSSKMLWSPYQENKDGGSRVMSIYLFLNTIEEDQGGSMELPLLNLSFRPKRGTAVLFPVVKLMDSQVEDDTLSVLQGDIRTALENKPIFDNVKYSVLITIREYPVIHSSEE